MKFIIPSIAALAAVVSATAIDINKRDSPLSVTITSVGNTQVKAAVKNSGDASYNLFYKGTILDSAPVDKLVVNTASNKASFEGVLLRLATQNLEEDAFMPLAAGETVEVDIDIAELYDVSNSDTYDVSAAGFFRYAELNSTELLEDALPFTSNSLSMAVDGAKASQVEKAVSKMRKRTAVSTDCTGTKRTAVLTALSNCASLATAAATAATNGVSQFSTFFKTTSTTTRSTVAARLRAVASDCSSSTSGSTTTHCVDTYSACSSNVLAYTLPSANYIVYCNLFFTYLPALSSTCYAQDQATTALHEETHAPGVYSPGTEDNGYGYTAATRLSTAAAVLNADSYALFANAVRNSC